MSGLPACCTALDFAPCGKLSAVAKAYHLVLNHGTDPWGRQAVGVIHDSLRYPSRVSRSDSIGVQPNTERVLMSCTPDPLSQRLVVLSIAYMFRNPNYDTSWKTFETLDDEISGRRLY